MAASSANRKAITTELFFLDCQSLVSQYGLPTILTPLLYAGISLWSISSVLDPSKLVGTLCTIIFVQDSSS